METDKPFTRKSKKQQAKYFESLGELYGRRPRNERTEVQLEFQFESTDTEGRSGANLFSNMADKK